MYSLQVRFTVLLMWCRRGRHYRSVSSWRSISTLYGLLTRPVDLFRHLHVLTGCIVYSVWYFDSFLGTFETTYLGDAVQSWSSILLHGSITLVDLHRCCVTVSFCIYQSSCDCCSSSSRYIVVSGWRRHSTNLWSYTYSLHIYRLLNTSDTLTVVKCNIRLLVENTHYLLHKVICLLLLLL